MLVAIDDIRIEQIVDIAKEAGKAILEVYYKDFDVEYKSDSSPLTIADQKANHIIIERLKQLSKIYPILSEEGYIPPYSVRKHWKYYWLIDPLDGTKEFIKKNGEFTVNIALIKDNMPTLGVVYAPVLDTTWTGEEGKPAKKIINGESSIIKVKRNEQNKKLIIVGSKSHASNNFLEFCVQYNDYSIISRGSSIKLCMIADGAADIYPRLGLTSEWDTAAAHAVVNSAGGRVVDIETKKVLKYNAKESLLNPFFLVGR